ncbi:MAG: nucleotidyltransferase substrate binding protein [Treponema sp.]|nr:nucleotidyltransferase substrate binding protein [Treponema sp.]
MVNYLKNGLDGKGIDDLSELEQGGIAKGFELCFELLWKLLKDYLDHEKIDVDLPSPANIIRTAASVGIIEKIGADGNIIIKMQKCRNELVHIYNQEQFFNALKDVKDFYLPQFVKVNNYFVDLINNYDEK